MSFLYVAVAGAGVGIYSSKTSADAQNEAVEDAIENAQRRYIVKANVARSQMTEQEQIATEKMTEVSRAFLKAKGTAKALQAETGVGGNIQNVKAFQLASQESETKGKVAKEIDTNVINIAQDMLASKIDTEAMIDEALSQGVYGDAYLTNMVTGALGGATSTITLGKAIEG